MPRIYLWLASLITRWMGMKPSHLFPSPSKFFLLRKMIACLNESEGMSIALDAACADFKYRDLFKTKHYVGVDLSPENLKKGIRQRACPSDLGVLTNLLNLEKTVAIADVVVSTHTLTNLPCDQRDRGAKILADAVMPNGTLFFNIPSDSDTRDLAEYLGARYGIVRRTAYGGPFYIAIENYFAYRTGSKNPLALIAIGTAALLCYFLSFTEEVSWMRSKKSYYTLYWCSNRKSGDAEARMAALAALSDPLPDQPIYSGN